jgi:hypothetical protein
MLECVENISLISPDNSAGAEFEVKKNRPSVSEGLAKNGFNV